MRARKLCGGDREADTGNAMTFMIAEPRMKPAHEVAPGYAWFSELCRYIIYINTL
jgi:hypothetical protein